MLGYGEVDWRWWQLCSSGVTIYVESFWQGKWSIMLFVLVASDMVEDEVVWMHLLNVVVNGHEDGVVIADGVSRVGGSHRLVDSFDNATIVAVYVYGSGSFQGEGV